MGRLVAVFGVSGVGKTSLISEFVRQHETWRSVSASGVLTKLLNRDAHELRISDREVVERNQQILADAIFRQRTAAPETDWLLDAHSLIDNDRELIAVPVEAIARLHPSGLVFVFDDVQRILERRASDEARRRPLPSVEQLESEQELALQSCLLYSKELGLDLYRVSATDPVGFAVTVSKTCPDTRGAV